MLMGSFLCIWEATCTSQIIIFSVSLFPHCVFVLSPVPQSHLTLCDLVDCSPPGSSAHGILFSRQEYWSWLPSPTPEDLPDPGIQPLPLAFTALAGGFFTIAPHGKAYSYLTLYWLAISFLFILIQANFVL